MRRSGGSYFVLTVVAVVVYPDDRELVTGFNAAGLEGEERVLRDRRVELTFDHWLAIQVDRETLDEVHREYLPLVILALPGFHRMLHQNANVANFTLVLDTDFDLFSHVQPPQPPSVTLISRKATWILPSADLATARIRVVSASLSCALT